MLSSFVAKQTRKFVPHLQRSFASSTQQTATDYADFDYSAVFNETEMIKFSNNLSSTLGWFIKAQTDYVISPILSISDKHNKSVLDVACGTGYYCHRMHQLGFGHIKGIDLSEKPIYSAELLCKDDNNVSFETMNALELLNNTEHHNKYDIVNASWLHCNAKNEKELDLFTYTISKCLKTGGIYTGIDADPNQVGSDETEWERFGVHLFNDKDPKYKPVVDGEYFEATFGVKGGPRIGFNKNIANITNINEEMKNQIDFGVVMGMFVYKKETMRKYLKRNNFVHIEFNEAKDWDFVHNANRTTLTEKEKDVFLEYVKMGNVHMYGFNAIKRENE